MQIRIQRGNEMFAFLSENIKKRLHELEMIPKVLLTEEKEEAPQKVKTPEPFETRRIENLVQENVAKLSIKTPSSKTLIQSLSGGNQQKVIISRWLANDPDILIMDEPTRGIDVGAKYEIYQIMIELAKQGKAIVMISSEMAELIGMSDRIVVMCDGRVTGEVSGEEATQENIMHYATQFN